MDTYEYNMLRDLKEILLEDLAHIRYKIRFGRNLDYLRNRENYCLKELKWISQQYDRTKI